MIVYVAAFAVLLLILFAAYRSLGAPAAAGADPEQVLAAAHRGLRQALATMAGSDAPVPDAARDGRRGASAAAQRLAGLAGGPEVIALRRDLLEAAAEDCSWAARLMEADGYRGNAGMEAAVEALLEHAGRCLDETERAGPADPAS